MAWKPFVLSVLALVLVNACAPAAPAPATEAPTPAPAVPAKLNVVISGQSGTFSGLFVAAEAGYFQEEGLDVTFTNVDSSQRAIPVLLSGEAQFSSLDAQTVVQTNLKGGDLRIIASATNRLVFSVMVDPSIKTPADLKGRRLGITSLGSGTHTAAVQALNLLKLEPDKDVALVPLNNAPNIFIGMQAKQVDGGVVSPPTNTRAKLSGFQELINLATDGPDYPSIAIGSTQSFLSKNPQAAAAFVRAYSRALHRYKTDQAMAVKAMGHYLQLDDQSVLEDTWKQYTPIFDDVPYVSERGVQNVIDTVAQTMPEAVGATPERFLDSSYVRQLEEGGFYKTLLNGS
jgi:NitT/TauT family transport system substrate-binding protein